MRVLIVDDSVVFRSQLRNCLDGETGIAVAGSAANGKIALERLQTGAYDLIVLDLEMPEMNGLQFLEAMRRQNLKQKVIVFAAPSKEGGSQVLEALRAGASDFIAKPQGVASLDEALESIRRELLPKILQFKRSHDHASELLSVSAAPVSQPACSPTARPKAASILLDTFKPRIVVVACSTGGPTALETLFATFKGHAAQIPILIVQHMPPHFTDALAKRLEAVSGLPAAEARAGEPLQNGRIYVAPGDYHMSIVRLPDNGKPIIKLDQGPKRNSVRPAADFLFESAAREFAGATAAFVLTGMGEDGRDGALAIKRASGAIMIQNRESSVVWGMPGAVHEAQAFDGEGDLLACAKIMRQMVS